VDVAIVHNGKVKRHPPPTLEADQGWVWANLTGLTKNRISLLRDSTTYPSYQRLWPLLEELAHHP